MARPDKAATVAEIAERFRTSNAAVLTEYRGLTVAQLTTLRRSIAANATYAVVKNTLTMRAAEQAGVSAFEGNLIGPSAIAFVTGDPVETAKGLRDFARTNPALVIKGGVLDGRTLSADEIRTLADLESRDVLLAKLAGAMKASLNNAAYLFVAPLSKAVRTVEALRQQREEAAGMPAATDGAAADGAGADPAGADPAGAGPAAAGDAVGVEAATTEG